MFSIVLDILKNDKDSKEFQCTLNLISPINNILYDNGIFSIIKKAILIFYYKENAILNDISVVFT